MVTVFTSVISGSRSGDHRREHGGDWNCAARPELLDLGGTLGTFPIRPEKSSWQSGLGGHRSSGDASLIRGPLATALNARKEEATEYQTLHELRHRAAVLDEPHSSKKTLLLRWADALSTEPFTKARLVHGFEFKDERSVILGRQWCRDARSPFSVAYADPMLRSEGFVRGTYEQAIHFFKLTNREAHYLLCDCHYPLSANFNDVARRVRRVARSPVFVTSVDVAVSLSLLLAAFTAAISLLPYLVR